MELLERGRELEDLRRMAAEAAEGPGRIALVSGEAGVGKTTLIREFTRALAHGNLWWGACDALQTPQPLAPLHDFARAVPGLREKLAADTQRATLFNDVLHALEAAGPAVVVIEDVHWADGATLDLIKFIGRRIDRTQALLILTFRHDELPATHGLRTAIGDLPLHLTTRFELACLSTAAVDALAKSALRSPLGLHAATGGNPFFVTEVLRHAGTEVPQSVQALVLARFARLPEASREVVQLVAVIPSRAERWLVDAILKPTPAVLGPCLDSGLLLVDGDYLRFRHELARAAIEGSIAPPVAEELHTRAFEVLTPYADDERLGARFVHHAARSNCPVEVMRHAPRAAAVAARRGAHQEAAAHFRTALRFASKATREERIAYLDGYATECQLTSQLVEATAAREEIAQLLRGSGTAQEGRNLSRLAIVHVLALRNADANACSREAIGILEKLEPGIELADAYRTEAQLLMLDRRSAESLEWGRKALALAERLGDERARGDALCSIGAALLYIDFDAARDHLRRAFELGDRIGHHYLAANALTNLGSGAGELLRLDEAERVLHEGIRYSAEKEVDFYRIYCVAWLGIVEMLLGRWDDAHVHAAEALAAASETSTARVMALVAQGRLLSRAGDEGAEAILDEALELAQASGSLQRVAPVRIARAQAAALRDDVPAAAAEARAALQLARDRKHPWHVGELGYWVAKAGEPPPPLEEMAEPHALLVAGDWRGAAAAWEKLLCPYEQARALADGDTEAKVEALAIFERLGARPAAAVVRKRLRTYGVKGVPRGKRTATQAHPAGLTSRESEILAMLDEGLRNSEIAERLYRSVRTIEHHVDAVLAKVGAGSRAEAVAIARRKGWVGKLGTRAAQDR